MLQKSLIPDGGGAEVTPGETPVGMSLRIRRDISGVVVTCHYSEAKLYRQVYADFQSVHTCLQKMGLVSMPKRGECQSKIGGLVALLEGDSSTAPAPHGFTEAQEFCLIMERPGEPLQFSEEEIIILHQLTEELAQQIFGAPTLVYER